MIKDRNCKDLIEETKKRWQEYTEKGKESEVAHLCLTICDPMDCNLPGSSAHGIFQARALECIAIFFCKGSSRPRDRSQVSHIAGRCFTVWATRETIRRIYRKVKVKSLSCVWVFATPWTVTYQVPLSMGFSRKEYWSGLPFPSPGDLPNPGIELVSPTL